MASSPEFPDFCASDAESCVNGEGGSNGNGLLEDGEVAAPQASQALSSTGEVDKSNANPQRVSRAQACHPDAPAKKVLKSDASATGQLQGGDASATGQLQGSHATAERNVAVRKLELEAKALAEQGDFVGAAELKKQAERHCEPSQPSESLVQAERLSAHKAKLACLVEQGDYVAADNLQKEFESESVGFAGVVKLQERRTGLEAKMKALAEAGNFAGAAEVQRELKHLCSAPQVEGTVGFQRFAALKSKQDALREKLEAKMNALAESGDFEGAADVQKQLMSILMLDEEKNSLLG